MGATYVTVITYTFSLGRKARKIAVGKGLTTDLITLLLRKGLKHVRFLRLAELCSEDSTLSDQLSRVTGSVVLIILG